MAEGLRWKIAMEKLNYDKLDDLTSHLLQVQQQLQESILESR